MKKILFVLALFCAQIFAATTAATIDVPRGGTGLTAGTQWGFPYYATTTTMASTAAGAANTVLHGNGSSAPTFSVVTPSDAAGNTSGSGNFALVGSPTFTGTPLSTTAAVDTNTTQIATTAYVIGQTYAKLASPTFTGTPLSTTAATSTNTTQIATTAFVQAASNNANYRTFMTFAGSHAAGNLSRVYVLPAGGNPTMYVGGGYAYPLQIIQIVSADYPTVDGKTTKLRFRVQIGTNATAPGGTYTFGLYPLSGFAGGAGGITFTLGAVVSGTNTDAIFVTPAASSGLNDVSAEFALPADGLYVLGYESSTTSNADSYIVITAQLQMRNN